MLARLSIAKYLLRAAILAASLVGPTHLFAQSRPNGSGQSSLAAQSPRTQGRKTIGINPPPVPAGAYILSPASLSTVYVGQAVSFSGSTDSGTSFSWNFGDGVTGTGLNTTHTYSATGTFTVSFTASASGYKTTTTTISLTVASAPTTPPTISSFGANPAFIASGGSSTLSWSTTNATSLSISNIGTVTGTSVVVKPTATTTYRLTATNAIGSVFQDVTVSVVPPPTIASFVASPTTIGLGQTSTLSWSSTNAATLSISGVGTVTGTSVAVKPTVTTTYTLTVTNAAGTVSSSLTVAVVQPPVISSFTASAPIIKAGQSSTLSWSVSGSTSLSISGIGTVTGTSLSVSPATTTTYTLTATNLAGGVTAVVTVKVPAKLTWQGDRIYGFGKLLSEDKPGATAGSVQSTYVQTDQVESVSIVTDASGVVLTQAKNLPSGERYAQIGAATAFERYASQEDSQGFSVYMQARTYLPLYGRFGQPDPLRASVNLYEYASSQFMSRLDPTGLADSNAQYNNGDTSSIGWIYWDGLWYNPAIYKVVNGRLVEDWSVLNGGHNSNPNSMSTGPLSPSMGGSNSGASSRGGYLSTLPLTGSGATLLQDSLVRGTYDMNIKFAPLEFGNPGAAVDFRNMQLENMRAMSSAGGQAMAEAIKARGKSLSELMDIYNNDELAIMLAARRSNPGITQLGSAAGHVGSVCLALGVTYSVMEVYNAAPGRKAGVASREAGRFSAGFVGANAFGWGGAILFSLGGPELAPVGYFVGNLVGGWMGVKAFDNVNQHFNPEEYQE